MKLKGSGNVIIWIIKVFVGRMGNIVISIVIGNDVGNESIIENYDFSSRSNGYHGEHVSQGTVAVITNAFHVCPPFIGNHQHVMVAMFQQPFLDQFLVNQVIPHGVLRDESLGKVTVGKLFPRDTLESRFVSHVVKPRGYPRYQEILDDT